MSESRQPPRSRPSPQARGRSDDEPIVRGYVATHPAGSARFVIGAGWDQFIYAASGTLRVRTVAGSWTVPPLRGLWLPDQHQVTVRATARSAVRALYLDTGLRALNAPPQVVTVDPFVRELVLHIARRCPLDRDDPVHLGLVTVLVDRLRSLPAAPLWLPMPAEPRALAFADAAQDDHRSTPDALARRCGTSRRTLERIFPAETGLTLGGWRRRCRVLAAVERLAAGATVTAAATAVGYATPSSFTQAFRAEIGQTPTAFLQHD